MSRVEINGAQTGFFVSGDIRFKNVVRLRDQGNCLIDTIDHTDLEVNLAGVTSSDTSGLSLLVRWVSYAKKQNKQLHFKTIPPTLLKIAGVCGISKLIGN